MARILLLALCFGVGISSLKADTLHKFMFHNTGVVNGNGDIQNVQNGGVISAGGAVMVPAGGTAMSGDQIAAYTNSGTATAIAYTTTNGTAGTMKSIGTVYLPADVSVTLVTVTNHIYYPFGINSNVCHQYTGVLKNTSLSPGLGIWKKNGITQHTRSILPLGLEAYTYPCVYQEDSLEYYIVYTELVPEVDPDGNVNINPTQGQGSGGGTATNTQGNGSFTNNAGNPPIAATNAANGGPINFGGGSGGGATEGTLAAGMNALLAGQQAQLAATLQQGSASNAISINITNIGSTNGLTLEQLRDYNLALSNQFEVAAAQYLEDALPTVEGHAGMLDLEGTFGATAMGGAFGVTMPEVAEPDSAYVASDLTIPMGLGTSMVIKPSSYPYSGVLRIACIWLLAYLLATKVQRDFFDALKDLFLGPQAQTAGTSLFGNNANAASAFGVAALICGVIVAAFATLLGYIFSVGTAAATAINPSAVWATLGWGASFIGSFLPIHYLVSNCISYFAFTIFKGSLRTVAFGVIKFLVGL